jgi:hypothetical protein
VAESGFFLPGIYARSHHGPDIEVSITTFIIEMPSVVTCSTYSTAFAILPGVERHL